MNNVPYFHYSLCPSICYISFVELTFSVIVIDGVFPLECEPCNGDDHTWLVLLCPGYLEQCLASVESLINTLNKLSLGSIELSYCIGITVQVYKAENLDF